MKADAQSSRAKAAGGKVKDKVKDKTAATDDKVKDKTTTKRGKKNAKRLPPKSRAYLLSNLSEAERGGISSDDDEAIMHAYAKACEKKNQDID